MADTAGSIFVEFITCLALTVWYCVVACVKPFLPVKKKDVTKDIVLITGSGSGIGRLMALRFASLGAQVVLWDINKGAIDAVAEEIRTKGGSAHAYYCDCSKREEIYRSAAQVKQDVGCVTVLINNAGIVSGEKFLETSDDKAALTFQVNTVAHLWTIKAFIPEMIANNHGHVITIASGAGLFGVAGLLDYCASKFGAIGIHEALTSDLATMEVGGVHTTVVCPYFIDTGMFQGVRTRFPLLLPILKPDYAVNKIMNAFHANDHMLLMPRIIYLMYFLQSFLPKRALLVSGKFFGVQAAMDTYQGRPKKED